MTNKVTKGRLRQVLIECGGVVAEVADSFGVTRQTVYNWIQKFELGDILEDAREGVYAMAQDNIFKAVKGGDLDMSKFVLTHMPTRSQKRWSSKHDVSATNVSLPISEETKRRLDALGIGVDDILRELEQMIEDEAV